jgi:hypothetical protein
MARRRSDLAPKSTRPGPLASQRKPDPTRRPAQISELEGRMVQCRIKGESTKISGAGFNFPALDFQRMAELQMGVCDIGIEFERFSIGVLGFSEIPGLLQGVAVLNPYRGIVRLLIERLSIIPRC